MTGTPELDPGYGPSTATGDNLLNDFVQESAASYSAFGAARGDRVGRVENVVTLIDAAPSLPFTNRAVLERPIDDLRTALEPIAAFFDTGPDTPFLLDSAWPTPDLRPFGYALVGYPPLMVRPAGEPFRPVPPELRIERVDDDSTARDFEYAMVHGYPVPQLLPMRDITVMTPPARTASGWHHFVGYVDDEPVASGSGYVGDRLVHLDNIATLESVRGRGYGVALTAAAAGADPIKPAALIASELGGPVYRRMGFVSMLRYTYWLGRRSA
jgi:ribosomal protein S18 acetylase RimI-like enzyme